MCGVSNRILHIWYSLRTPLGTPIVSSKSNNLPWMRSEFVKCLSHKIISELQNQKHYFVKWKNLVKIGAIIRYDANIFKGRKFEKAWTRYAPRFSSIEYESINFIEINHKASTTIPCPPFLNYLSQLSLLSSRPADRFLYRFKYELWKSIYLSVSLSLVSSRHQHFDLIKKLPQ